MERRRVAAIIRRGDRVLMVQERGRGKSGRHDGDEYWTLPGGGIDPGEQVELALVREVAEEVGLICRSWRHAFDYPYPSGLTAIFDVEVDPGEPRLGLRRRPRLRVSSHDRPDLDAHSARRPFGDGWSADSGHVLLAPGRDMTAGPVRIQLVR